MLRAKLAVPTRCVPTYILTEPPPTTDSPMTETVRPVPALCELRLVPDLVRRVIVFAMSALVPVSRLIPEPEATRDRSSIASVVHRTADQADVLP